MNVTLTESTKSIFFSDFLFAGFFDRAMKHFMQEGRERVEYYYPYGYLVVTKTNGKVIADWIPC